ncbi:TetR/AcrR family transcriptional regulator [Ramlibacter sp.]|uniref:TetR/AcrR family transcriptional regulator n=1 Tax=Ramlibacter sp. TaxID=1917967 RepID=UPI003D11DDC5
MAKRNVNAASDTRENLLRLAAQSFSTHGYAATTMRGIADLAGIEAASIYYHFGSKEDLVEAVMEHAAERFFTALNEHIATVPAGAGAFARFRAGLIGLMNGLVQHGDFTFSHNRLLGQLPDKVRERQVRRREEHHRLWTSMLEDLRAEGLIREDVDLGLCRMFVLGSINTIHAWFNPKKGSLETIADQLCSMLFEGVAAPGGRALIARELAES